MSTVGTTYLYDCTPEIGTAAPAPVSTLTMEATLILGYAPGLLNRINVRPWSGQLQTEPLLESTDETTTPPTSASSAEPLRIAWRFVREALTGTDNSVDAPSTSSTIRPPMLELDALHSSTSVATVPICASSSLCTKLTVSASLSSSPGRSLPNVPDSRRATRTTGASWPWNLYWSVDASHEARSRGYGPCWAGNAPPLALNTTTQEDTIPSLS